MRDAQRGRVYDWERVAIPGFNRATLSLQDCRRVIARVWDDYHPNSEPPHVVDGRGTRIARGSRSRINLPRWARSLPVVLHELAHALIPYNDRGENVKHGPEFVQMFIDLLGAYGGYDRHLLHKTARAHKIKIARADACPRPRHRRMKMQQGVIAVAKSNGTAEKDKVVSKSYKGNVARRTSGGKLIWIHGNVVNGIAACGADVTTRTEPMANKNEYFEETSESVTCGKCIRSMNKGESTNGNAGKAAATREVSRKATSKSARTAARGNGRNNKRERRVVVVNR